MNYNCLATFFVKNKAIKTHTNPSNRIRSKDFKRHLPSIANNMIIIGSMKNNRKSSKNFGLSTKVRQFCLQDTHLTKRDMLCDFQSR